MDYTVLPANYTMPAITPQPQSITALWLVLILPSLGGRRLSRPGGWLHTEIKCRLRETNPDTVTHPSTNKAQRRLTSLIETNDATTTPRRHLNNKANNHYSQLQNAFSFVYYYE